MIRLRHPTLFGENDRMFSPARDITLITYPIIKGAIEAATQKRPDLTEPLTELARALAGYCSSVVVDKRTLVELLQELRNKMPAGEARAVLMEELVLAFLLNFGEGARESIDSKVLLDTQIAALTEQGLLLSALDDELRVKVIKALKIDSSYEKELERKPLVGKVMQEISTDQEQPEEVEDDTPVGNA